MKNSIRAAIFFFVVFLFLVPSRALAADPFAGSPYTPGATLDPGCGPLVVNCTIIPPTTSGFSQSGNALGTTAFLGTTDNNALVFLTNNAEAMRILSDGTIGIGTASPTSTLTVNGTIIATGSLLWNAPYTTATMPNPATYHGMFAHNHDLGQFFGSHAGNWLRLVHEDTAGNAAITNSLTVAGNTTLGDAGTDTLTINSTSVLVPNNLNIDTGTLFIDAANNRIGIGTVTPNNKLQVANLINFNDTDFSVLLGTNAGFYPPAGAQRNIYLGYEAGYGLNIAATADIDDNIGIGHQALYENIGAVGNVAIGTEALYGNKTAIENVAIGYQAMRNNNGGTNVGVGAYALRENTSIWNVAVGWTALQTNTSGIGNTAVGTQALSSNTTGRDNVAVGPFALSGNTTSRNNVAMGFGALLNSTADDNTAIGWRSLNDITTGTLNTALGKQAGRYIANGTTGTTTNANSLYLGADTKAGANGNTNEIVIGYNAIGNGSNSVTLGNTGVTKTVLQGNVGIGTATPTTQLHTTGTVRFEGLGGGSLQTDAAGNVTVSSDARLKTSEGAFSKGLGALKGLTPVNYRWSGESNLETEHTYSGFLAQNVMEFIPEAVFSDKNGLLALSDRAILAATVNAVKEVDTKVEVNSLQLNKLVGLLGLPDEELDILKQDFLARAKKEQEAQFAQLQLEWNALRTDSKPDSETALTNNTLQELTDTGAITYNQDSIFAGTSIFAKLVTFIGDVLFKGRILYEDRDVAGEAEILSGDTEVTVTFERAYAVKPLVNATIVDAQGYTGTYSVHTLSEKGFTIRLEKTHDKNVLLNWSAIAVRSAKRFKSNGGKTSEATENPSSSASSNIQTPSPSISPIVELTPTPSPVVSASPSPIPSQEAEPTEPSVPTVIPSVSPSPITSPSPTQTP